MEQPINSADFGKTAEDYLTHRAGFPDSFFEKVAAWLPVPGSRILDLGTGTGTLAQGLSDLGYDVTGIDISPEMIRAARQRPGAEQIKYQVASAEQLPFPDASMDLICAGQCWHWFVRAKVAVECRRVLKPGSALLIAHYDWLPLPDSLVARTEELIKSFNPAWQADGGCGVHSQWFRDMDLAGFQHLASFSYDEAAIYTPEAWRGRIRASAGVAASLPPDQVQEFDQALEALINTDFPQDELEIPHRVFAVCGFAR